MFSAEVMCREGYKSALGFQAHILEVKDDLEAIIKQVGRERVKVSTQYWINKTLFYLIIISEDYH